MYRLGIEFSFFFLLYILEPDLKRKVEAWGGWIGFGQG